MRDYEFEQVAAHLKHGIKRALEYNEIPVARAARVAPYSRFNGIDPATDALVAHLWGDTEPHTDLELARMARFAALADEMWALNLSEHEAALMACRYAELVLNLFERACRGDLRPREAIDAIKQFVAGELPAAGLVIPRSQVADAAFEAGGESMRAAVRATKDWSTAIADDWQRRSAAKHAAMAASELIPDSTRSWVEVLVNVAFEANQAREAAALPPLAVRDIMAALA